MSEELYRVRLKMRWRQYEPGDVTPPLPYGVAYTMVERHRAEWVDVPSHIQRERKRTEKRQSKARRRPERDKAIHEPVEAK